MKKLVLGLSVLGSLAFTQAQIPNAPSEPRQERVAYQNSKNKDLKKGENQKGNHLERMKTELNLTDKQVSQIKALKEKQQKEREKEMAQQKAKFEQKREAYKKEMKKILTADQFQKWEEQGEKRKEAFKKMQEKRGQKRQHQNQ